MTTSTYVQWISATKWLEVQDPMELLGDDSVGWWLPLYSGKRLPAEAGERLLRQLKKILPIAEVGGSSLYTATALARTLARARLLNVRDEAVASFEKAITASSYF